MTIDRTLVELLQSNKDLLLTNNFEGLYNAVGTSSRIIPQLTNMLQDAKIDFLSHMSAVTSFMFYNNTKLDVLELPECIEAIHKHGFSQSNIKELKLPSNLQYIGQEAFSGCESLKQLTIPSRVLTLCARTFMHSKLQSIILKYGVEDIDSYCFAQCRDLTYIELPKTIKHIDKYAFGECCNLKSIKYKGTKIDWAYSMQDSSVLWRDESAITTIECIDGPIRLFNSKVDFGNRTLYNQTVSKI